MASRDAYTVSYFPKKRSPNPRAMYQAYGEFKSEGSHIIKVVIIASRLSLFEVPMQSNPKTIAAIETSSIELFKSRSNGTIYSIISGSSVPA